MGEYDFLNCRWIEYRQTAEIFSQDSYDMCASSLYVALSVCLSAILQKNKPYFWNVSWFSLRCCLFFIFLFFVILTEHFSSVTHYVRLSIQWYFVPRCLWMLSSLFVHVGMLAVQSLAEKQENFRIVATGVVLELDKSSQVKKYFHSIMASKPVNFRWF